MNPFDEDDEGDISIGESSAAEREMTPEIPKAPSVKTFDDDADFSSVGDVDQDTLRAFVACVLYANAAVLLVSLGLLIWFFEGWIRIGGVLFVVGVLAGIRTYLTYRAWDRSREDRDGDGSGDRDGDGSGDREGNAEHDGRSEDGRGKDGRSEDGRGEDAGQTDVGTIR